MDEPQAVPGRIDRRTFLLGATGAAIVVATGWQSDPARAGTAGPACDPFTTPPSFIGAVPTPFDVLGFDLGSQEVTVAESDLLVETIADTSDRVIAGTYGTSVLGRPLRYAIVGTPERVTPAGLATIQENVAALRDPATARATAQALAGSTPGIAWVIANIHGNEESGTDAALQILYELSDRDDCVVEDILDSCIVVIIPTQNPDGREANTRRNANGFDLNRDLFARTQPETDGKIELMRTYPPLVLVDSHESGYYETFFPPNNDPIYHELSDDVIHDFADELGPAMAQAFQDRGWEYFHGKVYDFFGPEFNDTVSANGFGAAGMTIEVDANKPIDARFLRQYVVDMSVLWRTAAVRPDMYLHKYDARVQAVDEGERGELQPNHRWFRPDKPVRVEVPDRLVRNYFILDEPGKTLEVAALVRRLQRMDVEVRQLDQPLDVPDFRPYGYPPARRVLPTGTYWISMAQPQKHWVQMLLHEEPYMPTIFTYGLAAWSSPLLMNLSGGSSGAALDPSGGVVGPVGEFTPPLPTPLPHVGLFQISYGSYALESAGGARTVMDGWGMPFTDLYAKDMAGGGLAGIDVLVVPGGAANPAMRRMGTRGRNALRAWVRDGGRYIGYRYGGARLAANLGLTTTQIFMPTSGMDGCLVRTVVDQASPLSLGVGPTAWVLYVHDLVLRSNGAQVVARYPHAGEPEFFISGYARGESDLFGTAAITDERVGDGRVILFGSDPAFRAFCEGTQRILLNAILGPDPFGRARIPAPSAADIQAAKDAARRLPAFESWFTLVVGDTDRGQVAALLRRSGARYTTEVGAGEARFLIDDDGGVSLEEHPWAMQILMSLERRNIEVLGMTGL